MKRFLEKFIALIIILSLFLGLGLNLFFANPNKAKAQFVDPVSAPVNIMQLIKDFALDSIAWVIKDVMLERLKTNIYDWGTGKKSDANLPFGIEDFQDYLDDFLNRATGEFIEKMRLTKYCSPIEKSFGERFKATFKVQYNDRPREEDYMGCSLNTVINNVEAFIKRPRITLFGWDAWKALTTPNNNIFGSFFLAQDVKIKTLRTAKTNAEKKAAINQGYKDEKETTATNKDKGKQTCEEKYPNIGPVDIPDPDACTSICGTDISFCLSLHPFENDYCNTQRINCLATTPACAPSVSPEGPSQLELFQQCIEDVNKQPSIPIEERIKNLGSTIANSMKKALDIESDKLGAVDEITELVGVFFQALVNKAMFTGLAALSSATQQATAAERAKTKNRDNYSYLRSFSKTNTLSKKKDIRAVTLASMDKTIKQLSRSIIGCKEKEVMKYEDYAKNINDFLEANVDSLYVGISGINIKPDAIVLDPAYAPYSVYGYSWGEIFSSKVPDKCRAILNQLHLATNTNCTDIISGLEPNYGQQIGSTGPTPQCNDDTDNDGDGLIDYPQDPGCSSITDNSEIGGGGGGGGAEPEERERTPQMLDIIPGFGENTCLPCMYDHDVLNCPQGPRPPQRYGTNPWTTAILQQKQTHYDSCRQWYDVALDRCDDCMKKYKSKCSRLRTDEEKNNCVLRVCGGPVDNPDALFEAIVPYVIDPPTNGLDFYNKCLIEEQKDSCFSCLAEYFIPATYCEQTKDYVARLIIKYPAMVKYVRVGDNKGQFLGLFDQTISDMGEECNDNFDKKNISLALICRILPDFSYKGEKVCRTRCFQAGMTSAQLNSITDFRPDENDCGNIKLDVGGKEPFNAIDRGVLDSRSKCCADFWQKDRKNYATCVGAGPTTEEPTTEPSLANLACTLSANPVSGLAPLNNVDLTVNASGLVSGNTMTYNFDCNNDGTIERTLNNTATGTVFNTTIADLCNYTTNNTTYTASATVVDENGTSATCSTSVQTTDCEITSTLNPANGIIPVTTSITGRLNTTDTGPFTFRFYCSVPTDGGPISSWSGETIEYVSSANPFTLTDACSFTSSGPKGIGVSILNNASGSTSSCYQVINVSDAPSIACSAESLSSMVTTNGPVDIVTTAMPNSAYISLIHSAVGTTFSYDCDNNGTFNNLTQTTSNTIHEATLYCSYPTSGTYTIAVRVGNTNPANGFSAFNTCETSVDVESSGAFIP